MKNTIKKPARKGFVLNRNCQVRGYADFRISFVRASRWDVDRAEFAKLTLRWQANDNPIGEKSDWYGLHAEMDCDRLDTFVEESKLAASLERLTKDTRQSPADFVAKLEAAGWVRYVQDRRVSPDLVPFDQVFPADFKRYVPNYTSLGWDSCHVSCIARDETAAGAMLLQELCSWGELGGANPVAVKRCKEFLDAAMPVRLAGYSDAPEMISTAEILMSPKAREAANAETLAMAS